MKRPIYLDHHATTPVDSRVVEAMRPFWSEDFGNASSATHAFGWRAEAAVEHARERLAAAIGAEHPSEIVFTSGTTESDNLAVLGVARAARRGRDQVVTSSIEHPAVLDACTALEKEGFEVLRLPVDPDGRVDPGDVAEALCDRTALVSVMAANSEIGVLQPIREIGQICRRREVPFHTDAAQAVGKVPVHVVEDSLDLLSMCAHKLYGPKGVGALYVRRGRPRIRLAPLLHGGGHERGLRPGTLPVPLIVGFARAVEISVADREEEGIRLGRLRDRLWERLQKGLPGIALTGHALHRLPGNLHVSFEGVEAGALLAALPDLALSSGSACASGRAEPSHVLLALGLPPERALGAVRFGLGRGNTASEIDRAADRVIEEVRALRALRLTGRERRGPRPR